LVYIGVDPGSVSGALGALDHQGNYLEAFNIEHQDKHILALVFKSRILSLVDPKIGAEICMEQVHSMPNQGVSSTFAFGRSAGVIEGVLAALQVPVTYVQPAVWARTMNKGYGKDASRHRAMELFPDKQEWFKLVKHDGRAEAVLIAMWGLKQL